MAFTISDLQDLTLLLNRHPEWQAEVRRLVLTSELLALPDLVRELAEAQRRTEQRLERLSIAVIDSRESQQRAEQRLERLEEGQTRSEQRFDRLETALARLADAQARTDEKMTELVAAQARTDEKMTELVAAQARTDEKMTELVAAQTRTDEKMAELVAAQARTDEKIAVLTATQEKFTREMIQFRRVQEQLVTDVGSLKGREVQQRYIQYAPGYFGNLLRRVRVIWPGALESTLEDRLDEYLTREERADVLRLDGIIRGVLSDADRSELYLALEVSRTIEANDIIRARQRATLLRKAGLRTLPVVAGEGMSEEAQQITQQFRVVVVTNGHSEGWDETLASV